MDLGGEVSGGGDDDDDHSGDDDYDDGGRQRYMMVLVVFYLLALDSMRQVDGHLVVRCQGDPKYRSFPLSWMST
jgi:hypothetical protein